MRSFTPTPSRMGAKFLPFICPPTSFLDRPSPVHIRRTSVFYFRRETTPSTVVSDSTSNNSNGGSTPESSDDPQDESQPPRNVSTRQRQPSAIRYRSRSRKQARRQRGNDDDRYRPPPPPPPKSWEEMTVREKALELYVGEKGLLFWLNKFAYASIFIIIGGWVLFRFVGPALDLYQLDRTVLSPSDVLKGSS